jgi:hypothetical protein
MKLVEFETIEGPQILINMSRVSNVSEYGIDGFITIYIDGRTFVVKGNLQDLTMVPDYERI